MIFTRIIGHEAVEVYARQQKKELRRPSASTRRLCAGDEYRSTTAQAFSSTLTGSFPDFDGLNDQFVRYVGTEGTAYINLTYQGLQICKPELNEPFERANRATVSVNPMFGSRTTGCIEQSVTILPTAF